MTAIEYCVIWLLLLAVPGLSQEGKKPACNAETQGRMWPAEANDDRRLAIKLARCGQLEICGRGFWRYRWEFLSIRIDQLRRDGKAQRPADCEPLSEAGSGLQRGADPAK